MASERRWVRRMIAAVVMVLAAFGTASCADPEFTYIQNSGEKTYLRVPSSWTQVDATDVDNLYSPFTPNTFNNDRHLRRQWSVAYDGSAYPSEVHLTQLDLPADQPAAYLVIRKLLADEKAAISLDKMRNFVFPVTDDARAAYQARVTTGGLTDFELLNDEELTFPSGLHGIRTVYNWRVPSNLVAGGVLNTFDLTVLLSPDSNTVYMLFIRCDYRCYQLQFPVIDAIANSLTIRS